MKKAFLLLLSGLFLYGCGGGGGETAVTSGGGTSTPTQAEAGGAATGFTLNIVDGSAASTAPAVTRVTALTVPGTPPTAEKVRVVIRRFVTETIHHEESEDEFEIVTPAYDEIRNTEVYRDIQDVNYSSTGRVEIGIPAGTGYTIDVITSKDLSGVNSVLKYGQGTGIDVGPTDSSATITIKSVHELLDMRVADSVSSKGAFNATVNNVLPFATNYKMTMRFGANLPVVVNSSTGTSTFTAPESFVAGTISLQGQFSLHPSFLKQNELQSKWVRNFPEAAYGESVTSELSPLIRVSVPVGTP